MVFEIKRLKCLIERPVFINIFGKRPKNLFSDLINIVAYLPTRGVNAMLVWVVCAYKKNVLP